MTESSSSDSYGEDSMGNSETRTGKLVTSLSDSLGMVAESTKNVIRNLNLVGSISILVALASLWLNFRGAYTATVGAVGELNPVVASLFPSALIGLTVFFSIWCVVHGWYYAKCLRTRFGSELVVRVGLKKLVPEIETCLFFLERLDQVADEGHQERLLKYISESGLTVWEEMMSLGLDGPTAYGIQAVTSWNEFDRTDTKELQRLLKLLLPLARRGKVKEARRIY